MGGTATIRVERPKGEPAVRRIVLDMQYPMTTQALCRALETSDPDFQVQCAELPAATPTLCRAAQAGVLLMEVVPRPPRTLQDRLQTVRRVHTLLPRCKMALLVDEAAYPELAAAVRMAKKDGLIDTFVYGSISPTYLSAIIDTL